MKLNFWTQLIKKYRKFADNHTLSCQDNQPQ